MNRMLVEASAKINLTLDILGKRPDGYHELRSVMQSVSLCDRLSVTLNGTGKIRVFCDRPDVPTGPENTVYRAAEAFFRKTGLIGKKPRPHGKRSFPVRWERPAGRRTRGFSLFRLM